MAASPRPLPPIARSVTALEWAIVLGIWLLLAVSAAGQLQVRFAARGVMIPTDAIRIAQVIDWAIWALLLPVIFLVLDRLPLRRKVWPKHLLGWVVVGLVAGTAHALLSLPLIHFMARVLAVSPDVLALPELRPWNLAVDDAQNFNLAAIAYLVLQRVHRARDERARAREVESSLREAKLHALALELQPHFLFNTLNGIAALVRSDPKTAERMLVQLSDLLRMTLESGKVVRIPLGDEMRQLGLYLGLQQMRHGSRLTVHTEVAADLDPALVPAMVLQPLVENALTHGVGARTGPCSLWIRARHEAGRLRLMVEDDGVGVPAGGPAREGIGISNTRSRLGALYPEEHAFRIGPRDGGGTSVSIELPYETAGSAVKVAV